MAVTTEIQTISPCSDIIIFHSCNWPVCLPQEKNVLLFFEPRCIFKTFIIFYVPYCLVNRNNLKPIPWFTFKRQERRRKGSPCEHLTHLTLLNTERCCTIHGEGVKRERGEGADVTLQNRGRNVEFGGVLLAWSELTDSNSLSSISFWKLAKFQGNTETKKEEKNVNCLLLATWLLDNTRSVFFPPV